tara:strand:- start:98 stop:1333 length:1236 start_codon:yes stop_codon:yes gene_type:complete
MNKKAFKAKRCSLISKLLSTLILTLTEIPAFIAQASPYKGADFNRLTPGRLNISVYTFHDKNRNGIYDLGDLPMAGVITEMKKPNGMIINATSNKNGYINYKMALGSNNSREISQEGKIYTFKVLKPPGWQITAGKPEQKILFVDQVGSPGGLIADKAPNWVGLAPELSLKGKLIGDHQSSPPKDASVIATGPNGKSKRLKLNKDGSFILSVEPGIWSLVYESKSLDWKLVRNIKVTNVPVDMVAIFAGKKELPVQANEIVENFDWINHSGLEKIPNGHNGLNWNYLLAMFHQTARGPGYINVLNSGHGVAYNSSGHPVTITAQKGEFFDFIGGYFTVAWEKANGEILEVEAFRGNKRIAQHEMKLSHLGATWLHADLRRIDKLILSTRHYWQFSTDDLHFRVPIEPDELP